MRLGARIRSLSRHRLGLAVSALIAAGAALLSVATISLLPPGIHSRSVDIAAASTQVMLDTPDSLMVDVRQDAAMLEGFTDRAVLLGNVMTREPVRLYIADQAGIPVEALMVEAPLTARQPRRRRVEPGREMHVSDVVATSDQHRLSIQADPTVPLIDVYAQAPTAAGAEAIANAAVDGLRRYLDDVATESGTPSRAQLELVQLGRAHGAVINAGSGLQVAFVAFLLTFAICCALVVAIDRVRRGWRLADLSEPRPTD